MAKDKTFIVISKTFAARYLKYHLAGVQLNGEYLFRLLRIGSIIIKLIIINKCLKANDK